MPTGTLLSSQTCVVLAHTVAEPIRASLLLRKTSYAHYLFGPTVAESNGNPLCFPCGLLAPGVADTNGGIYFFIKVCPFWHMVKAIQTGILLPCQKHPFRLAYGVGRFQR